MAGVLFGLNDGNVAVLHIHRVALGPVDQSNGRGREIHADRFGECGVGIAEHLDAGGTLADAYYVDQSPYANLDTFEELATINAGRVFEQMEFE